MKFAVLESIITTGGHEIDFNRIIVDELVALGHQVEFYVPANYVFKFDYHAPVRYLPGTGVSYEGVRGLRKALCAAKREINRQRWYRAAYEHALRGECDAIIVPTSTYRYLRALSFSRLKKSPVPVIFIVHGINPGEAAAFFRETAKLAVHPNIRAAVLTLEDNIFGNKSPNVFCLRPPVFSPRDIDGTEFANKSGIIKLGFFGQYRKEKNLDAFLDIFLACRFTNPVVLQVQGATMNPVDADDFTRIINKYSGCQQLSFLHKALVGIDWQKAIAGVDALVMPYSATRYLYHWSAMLFNALGYLKPVIANSMINPQIAKEYSIGSFFAENTPAAMQSAIQDFVNSYYDRLAGYKSELARAYLDYSPSGFAQALVRLAQK